MSDPREVKVVLLGDTGVGKSSLVLRFVTNSFKSYSESTIGASFMRKIMSVDGNKIKFQIWDTAGQEKYHSLAPMYYRGAAVAIVVYDITRKSSFTTLQMWIKELRQLGPEDIVIVIAANKCDLDDDREVETSTAKTYAKSVEQAGSGGQGALFFETSAKEDTNVGKMFTELSRRLPKLKKNSMNNYNNKNLGVKNNSTQSGGCC